MLHNLFWLFFIRLSIPHDPRIVLNGLTLVDMSHFLCYFLIKIYINFIVQHCVWQGWLKIKFHDLF